MRYGLCLTERKVQNCDTFLKFVKRKQKVAKRFVKTRVNSAVLTDIMWQSGEVGSDRLSGVWCAMSARKIRNFMQQSGEVGNDRLSSVWCAMSARKIRNCTVTSCGTTAWYPQQTYQNSTDC